MAVAEDMFGGEVVIKGDAGIYLGQDALKGKIEVGGEIASIHDSCQSEVYNGGKKVWPKE